MCQSLANLKLSRESRAAVLETDLSQSVEVLSPGPGRMRDTRSKSVLSIGPPADTHQVGIMVSRGGHYFLMVPEKHGVILWSIQRMWCYYY